MSGLFGFSRQAYYQHENRQLTSEERDQRVLDLVAQVREDPPRMGGKKLYYLLKDPLVSQGIKLGRDALFDILAANNLLIRRRKRKTITTFSRHQFRKDYCRTGQPRFGLSSNGQLISRRDTLQNPALCWLSD